MDVLPAEYTYVSTADELQRAVLEGARDVVIQEHIDLTGLSRQADSVCDGCTALLGSIHPGTRSIQVCTPMYSYDLCATREDVYGVYSSNGCRSVRQFLNQPQHHA